MNQKLSNSVLYLMSISAGLVVANLYYNQPLLKMMANSLNVTESAVSNVALLTQIGFAFGLLFVVPLGDKISNKTIIKFDFLLMIIALLAMAYSKSITTLIISSFFVGFTSAIPQLFVPMAAQMTSDQDRPRAIGIVMSGLLIGILGSRVISGLIGDLYGWRFMYQIAAGMMVSLYIVLHIKLPKLSPAYKGSYGSLLMSIFHYFKKEPSVRLAALRGGLAFAGLSAFWTTLVFLMEKSFNYGSAVTGVFGLFGIAGALAAAFVGRINNHISKHKIIIYSTIVMIISWVVFLFSASSLFGIAIGVILVDLGLQGLHITNQNIIFSKNPEARNRINTIYMVGFFIGGAVGTAIGAIVWKYFGWNGVSSLGILLSILIATVQIMYEEKTI